MPGARRVLFLKKKNMMMSFLGLGEPTKEFFKNLPDISSLDFREFNGSEDN